LLAAGPLRARRSPAQLRQAVRAGLSRIHPLEQAAAGAESARRRDCEDAGKIRAGLPVAQRPGARMNERLQRLIEEMIEKGIRFSDDNREFERRFISRVLVDSEGNLSKTA